MLQIIQITFANLLIENSSLTFVNYLLPIIFITTTIISIFIENVELKRYLMLNKINIYILKIFFIHSFLPSLFYQLL